MTSNCVAPSSVMLLRSFCLFFFIIINTAHQYALYTMSHTHLASMLTHTLNHHKSIKCIMEHVL